MNQYSTVAGTIIVERDNFVAVWIAYAYNTSLSGELAISACSRCLDVRRLFIYFLLPISARSMVRPTEYCSTALDTLVQKPIIMHSVSVGVLLKRLRAAGSVFHPWWPKKEMVRSDNIPPAGLFGDVPPSRSPVIR